MSILWRQKKVRLMHLQCVAEIQRSSRRARAHGSRINVTPNHHPLEFVRTVSPDRVWHLNSGICGNCQQTLLFLGFRKQ